MAKTTILNDLKQGRHPAVARYQRAYDATYARFQYSSTRFVLAAMEALAPTQDAYENLKDAKRGEYDALEKCIIERQ